MRTARLLCSTTGKASILCWMSVAARQALSAVGNTAMISSPMSLNLIPSAIALHHGLHNAQAFVDQTLGRYHRRASYSRVPPATSANSNAMGTSW